MRIRSLTKAEIDRPLFHHFVRTQEVRQCWRKEAGRWVIRDIAFVDDWDEPEYLRLIACLQNTIQTGGLVIGAFVEDRLKGFASVEKEKCGSRGQYMDLSYLYVSQELRGHGIGRALFEAAKAFARENGAEKLYLSAHSAVESQAFYRAMHCKEAEEPIAAHVEAEPCDCQLECALNESRPLKALKGNLEEYRRCALCPRQCGADRTTGKGRCGVSANLTAARAALHFWEEPCISGENGSGAVFFSGCPLQCVYCQNHDISLGGQGKTLSEARLSDIFLKLQQQGAHNINLVTATQWLPHLLPALAAAKQNGLFIPVVYNTSGYERVETLRRLAEYVDIWLPDMKYHAAAPAAKYSGAADYFDVASRALTEMVRQAGPPQFDENGILRRGVIVRHLLLPGLQQDSRALLRHLHASYGGDIWISIMNQYTPLSGQLTGYAELDRKITAEEYDEMLDFALSIGIENAFIQEGETAQESFIPVFDGEGLL